jgi:hypothetical protein
MAGASFEEEAEPCMHLISTRTRPSTPPSPHNASSPPTTPARARASTVRLSCHSRPLGVHDEIPDHAVRDERFFSKVIPQLKEVGQVDGCGGSSFG